MDKILIFLIDAFAYEYLSKTNFLEDLDCEVSSLKTLLGYSSTIMPSIWSGSYPEETGLWTEFYFRPRKPYRIVKLLGKIPNPYLKYSIKYGLFKKFLQKKGHYRQTLLGIPESIEHFFSRNDIQYWKFPPIELKNETFYKMLVKKKLPYHFEFFEYEIPYEQTLSSLELLKNSTQSFIYYIATLDACGHVYGPKPASFKEKIDGIENLIINSHKLLSKKSKTHLFVFSDHGMTKITQRYDVLSELSMYKLGRDYLAFIDSTLARFWFFNKKAEEDITDILTKSRYGHILSENEIKNYGLRFKDNRYGDLIFLANPGVELFPSFMRPTRFPLISREPLGMHGYSPEHNSSNGIFMYCGDENLNLKKKMHVTEIFSKLKCVAPMKSKSVICNAIPDKKWIRSPIEG